MVEVDSLVGQPDVVQLSHILAMLRFPPAVLAEIWIILCIWVEGVHPSVNNALVGELAVFRSISGGLVSLGKIFVTDKT